MMVSIIIPKLGLVANIMWRSKFRVLRISDMLLNSVHYIQTQYK